jgi:hypothetical protein
VYLAEAGYEFEQNSPSFSKGTPEILRRQEYWTALSGSTGQFYGNRYIWPFAPGWTSHLDTPGSVQLGYLARLFAGMRWHQLVPDQSHTAVTGGYRTYTEDGNVGSSDYVTTASTQDGTLTVSYLPVGGTITVDTSRLAPGSRRAGSTRRTGSTVRSRTRRSRARASPHSRLRARMPTERLGADAALKPPPLD